MKQAPPEWFNFFPVFFIGVWVGVSTLLGFLCGWFTLAAAFPDSPEPALFTLSGKSGRMRGIGLNNILKLSVCTSGLRIGMPRIVAPFQRPFLVPWRELFVERKKGFVADVAELTFGSPKVGALTIHGVVANQLARAAPHLWPEVQSTIPPPPTTNEVMGRVLRMWLLRTGLVASFLTLAPRLLQTKPTLPMGATIAFPAIFFAIVAAAEFTQSKKG